MITPISALKMEMINLHSSTALAALTPTEMNGHAKTIQLFALPTKVSSTLPGSMMPT